MRLAPLALAACVHAAPPPTATPFPGVACIAGAGRIADVVRMPNGEIVIAGSALTANFGPGWIGPGVVAGERAFVARYDRDRRLLHVLVRPSRRAPRSNEYTALVLTGGGDVIVAGRHVDNATLERFAPDGTPRWTRELVGSTAEPAEYLDLALAPDGDLVATALVDREVTLVRFAPDGELRWQRRLPEAGTPARVAITGAGEIVVATRAVRGELHISAFSDLGTLHWRLVAELVGPDAERLRLGGFGIELGGIAAVGAGVVIAGNTWADLALGAHRAGAGGFVITLDGDGIVHAIRPGPLKPVAVALRPGGEIAVGTRTAEVARLFTNRTTRWRFAHRGPWAVSALAGDASGLAIALIPTSSQMGWVGCIAALR